MDIEVFLLYLTGVEFHVYTDNDPVSHFQSSRAEYIEMRW